MNGPQPRARQRTLAGDRWPGYGGGCRGQAAVSPRVTWWPRASEPGDEPAGFAFGVQAGDARGFRWTAGFAPLARVVLSRGQLAVPGQQRRGCHGKSLCPAPAGKEPSQRGEPNPAGRLVPYLASLAAQRCVLVPEHQQLSSLRPVAADHQDSHAGYPARQQIDDLEQHPPVSHHRVKPAGDSAGRPLNRVFGRHKADDRKDHSARIPARQAVQARSSNRAPQARTSGSVIRSRVHCAGCRARAGAGAAGWTGKCRRGSAGPPGWRLGWRR